MSEGALPPFIYSKGRPTARPPRPCAMMAFCMRHRPVKSSSCRGSMGKWRRPHPINGHASSRLQAVRARGAPQFPFGFAWKPSPSAPWAQGLLPASWIQGYPALPTCGPPRGSINGLVQPSFSVNNSRPSRGAKPRKVDDAKTPEGIGLFRLAPKGQIILCKVHLMRLS